MPLIYVLLMCLFSCKIRPQANPFNLGQKDVDIPDEELANVCSQNIFYIFIGNAENLGEIVFRPGRESQFLPGSIDRWKQDEHNREAKYFKKIEDVAAAIHARNAKGQQRCLSPIGKQKLKNANLLQGSLAILTITDGPNHTQRGDSRIHFSRSGLLNDSWQTLEDEEFAFIDGKLSPYDPNLPFEILVPNDSKKIIDETLRKMPNLKFTQTILAYKGHSGMSLGMGYEPNFEYILMNDANSRLFESVSMLDSHGDLNEFDHVKDFYVPVWGEKSIADPQLNLAELTKETHSTSKEMFTTILTQLKTSLINLSFLNKARESLAQTGNSRQGTDERQGTNDKQSTDGKQDGMSLPGYWDTDLSLLEIGLGDGPWRGGTQSGGKTSIFNSNTGRTSAVTKVNIESNQWQNSLYELYKKEHPNEAKSPVAMRSYMPDGFRLLGKGIHILASFTAAKNPEDFFKSRHYTIVNDTCMIHPLAAHDFAKHLLGAWSEKDWQPHSIVGFSNPQPLEIDAINYSILDGFQIHYLSEAIRIEAKKFEGPNIAVYRMSIPISEEMSILKNLAGVANGEPSIGKETTKRLLASVMDCPAGKIDVPHCNYKLFGSNLLFLDNAYADIAALTGSLNLILQKGMAEAQLLPVALGKTSYQFKLSIEDLRESDFSNSNHDRNVILHGALGSLGHFETSNFYGTRHPWKPMSNIYALESMQAKIKYLLKIIHAIDEEQFNFDIANFILKNIAELARILTLQAASELRFYAEMPSPRLGWNSKPLYELIDLWINEGNQINNVRKADLQEITKIAKTMSAYAREENRPSKDNAKLTELAKTLRTLADKI